MNAVVESGDQVQETAPAKTKNKQADQNLIMSVAHEVESLTKTKALNLAKTLADDIETNYFKLGGVLSVIHQNAWFEGYESFDAFVYEKFGFKGRKAEYLMGIYNDLVVKQIPWEKVQALGWTKLKEITKVLTADNVDEWVAKVQPLTFVELMKMLKDGTPGDTAPSTETKSSVQKLSFTLKNDQIATVQTALASVKAQVHTDYDDVALEALCAAHLAGVGGTVSKAEKPLLEVIKEAGYEAVLAAFEVAFPQVDLTVQVKE